MGRGDSRSQDPNIRDQRNGSVLDMMRVECLRTDLQMGTPRRRPSGEGRGLQSGARGGESSVEVVVTELRRDDITQGKCAEQTTWQSSVHCWTEA